MQNKKISNKTTRILGIDPGYGRLGIAIIEKENSKETLLHSECFETSAKLTHSQRLLLLGEKVKEIIEEYKPS